jgi:hypothetical protein
MFRLKHLDRNAPVTCLQLLEVAGRSIAPHVAIQWALTTKASRPTVSKHEAQLAA